MTAADAQTAELWALVHRAKGALELLPPALESRDLLTARYAAATLTQIGDQIETALLTLDRDARAVKVGAIMHYPTER